ncbi:hypothetical protein CRH09_26305 [Nocardia terpenica]|uniref:Uncharacterized protein n=1 Tax=Nocardia terpenica TaxID=455432 RepID=A0A291RPH1_9NOCA|nr:hypothetical protein CRH09_26305 [Nocardia terpenica]
MTRVDGRLWRPAVTAGLRHPAGWAGDRCGGPADRVPAVAGRNGSALAGDAEQLGYRDTTVFIARNHDLLASTTRESYACL